MTRKLLTAEGYDTLKKELDHILRVERPETTKIVTWAASLGDRSENADYTANKRKLRQLDHRIRFLTKLFDVAQRFEYNPQQEGKAYFGAWISLEDEDGQELTFRIVGNEEIYQNSKYISLNSPMAKACLGKKEDDEIEIITPDGRKVWVITNIKYL
ncbi:transcription elongation factor GreB [Ignatzschineria sp. LJL83]